MFQNSSNNAVLSPYRIAGSAIYNLEDINPILIEAQSECIYHYEL